MVLLTTIILGSWSNPSGWDNIPDFKAGDQKSESDDFTI